MLYPFHQFNGTGRVDMLYTGRAVQVAGVVHFEEDETIMREREVQTTG